MLELIIFLVADKHILEWFVALILWRIRNICQHFCLEGRYVSDTSTVSIWGKRKSYWAGGKAVAKYNKKRIKSVYMTNLAYNSGYVFMSWFSVLWTVSTMFATATYCVYRACLIVHVLTVSTICLQFLQRLRLQLYLPVPVHLYSCAPSVHHHLGSLPVFLPLFY